MMRGHLTIDDALSMKGRVSRNAWECEMLCLRPRRDHAVLPEFNPAIHVFGHAGDPTPVRDLEDDLVCGMDFGYRSPAVVLWALQSRGDRFRTLRIVAERVVAGARLGEHVEAIMGSRLGLPAWIGVDPAGNARSDQTGASNVETMRKAGLKIRWRKSLVHEGLNLIRTRLDPATMGAAARPGTPAGPAGPAGPSGPTGPTGPTLLIHARCVRLIESLTTHHYDPDNPRSLQPVKDGSDHAVDALRYLVANVDRPDTRAGNYLRGRRL